MSLSPPRLGHQQLGRECLPGSDPLWHDGFVRVLWCRPQPVEALAEVPYKAVGLTEPLRSARRLAPAKHAESSFEVLVIPLDALLHGLSREMLHLREHFGPSGRVGSRLI